MNLLKNVKNTHHFKSYREAANYLLSHHDIAEGLNRVFLKKVADGRIYIR